MHTLHSLCWAVIVIFIFITTLAEDIFSLRLHVRLGDRREVPLEDWVSLGLQLGQYLCLALKIQDVNSPRLHVLGVNMGVFGRLGQFRIITGAIFVPLVILLLVN